MKLLRRTGAAVLALLLFAAPVSAGAFSDVTQETSPYAQAIDALYELGVIAGYPDGSYRPDQSYTREEFAQLLKNLLAKQQEVSVEQAPFPDVEQERWSASAVAWAVQTGAIEGRDDGLFWPQDTVSLPEAAKMLLIASGLSQDNLSFPDGYLEAARQAGLLEGVPQEGCTRGSVAQMAWNTLQNLESEEELALGLGMQNGRLCLMRADGSKLLLTPVSGLELPDKLVGVLFSYSATEGGLLLSLTQAAELETGIDASQLATQFSNISNELKLGNPDDPEVAAKVTEDTVIYQMIGTEDTGIGYTVIDRDDLPMINGGSGVSTCKVLTCVQEEGVVQAMLVSAPGDLSKTGVYYGLLESASMVSDKGKSRYLLNVLVAGEEMTLLTKATSGDALFAPQGSDEDYLMAGRSYVRLRIGEDGAVDQLVKLLQTGQDTPRWVRGAVTALPGDGKGISLSQGYTVQDGVVVPGEDFYSDITVYTLYDQGAVYTVDAFPQDGEDGLLALDDEVDVSIASVESIGVSDANGGSCYVADLLLNTVNGQLCAVAVFTYLG